MLVQFLNNIYIYIYDIYIYCFYKLGIFYSIQIIIMKIIGIFYSIQIIIMKMIYVYIIAPLCFLSYFIIMCSCVLLLLYYYIIILLLLYYYHYIIIIIVIIISMSYLILKYSYSQSEVVLTGENNYCSNFFRSVLLQCRQVVAYFYHSYHFSSVGFWDMYVSHITYYSRGAGQYEDTRLS